MHNRHIDDGIVGKTVRRTLHFIWIVDESASMSGQKIQIELLVDELALDKIGSRNVPPVVILLSDGYCTDSESRYDAAIKALDGLPWGVKAVRIAIGIGADGSYNKTQLDQFITP